MKDLTFKAASKSAISWGMNDLIVPEEKAGFVAAAEVRITEVKEPVQHGSPHQ
jgi:hypothetical protein